MNIRHTVFLSFSILALTACGEEAPPTAQPETTPEVAAAPAEPAQPAQPPAAVEPAPEPVAIGTVPAPSAEDLAQATQTGTLARSILRDPAQAESLLGGASLTAATFEARVYAIARNPQLTDAYRAALEAP